MEILGVDISSNMIMPVNKADDVIILFINRHWYNEDNGH